MNRKQQRSLIAFTLMLIQCVVTCGCLIIGTSHSEDEPDSITDVSASVGRLQRTVNEDRVDTANRMQKLEQRIQALEHVLSSPAE